MEKELIKIVEERVLDDGDIELVFEVEDEFLNKLKDVAQLNGMDVESFIKEALHNFIEEYKND